MESVNSPGGGGEKINEITSIKLGGSREKVELVQVPGPQDLT